MIAVINLVVVVASNILRLTLHAVVAGSGISGGYDDGNADNDAYYNSAILGASWFVCLNIFVGGRGAVATFMECSR